jgi:hypothetical protein
VHRGDPSVPKRASAWMQNLPPAQAVTLSLLDRKTKASTQHATDTVTQHNMPWWHTFVTSCNGRSTPVLCNRQRTPVGNMQRANRKPLAVPIGLPRFSAAYDVPHQCIHTGCVRFHSCTRVRCALVGAS